MELTEIKGSIFGYKKESVRQYISELNQIQGTELAAEKASAAKAALKYEEQIKDLDKSKAVLETKNNELSDRIASLENELSELKAAYAQLEEMNTSLNEKYTSLEEETQELRDKSDVISTAIINAEKCATTMINDADVRAKEMIDEAEGKVADEVKRLDVTKIYIAEVRDAVDLALRKIDAELGGIEKDIDDKKTDVYSDNRRSAVKERFGTFFKKA